MKKKEINEREEFYLPTIDEICKRWPKIKPFFYTKGKYQLKPINDLDTSYKMIVGERSNGKTFQILLYAMCCYFWSGACLVYGRRNDNQITGANGSLLYQNFNLSFPDIIKTLSDGKYNYIYHYGSKWFPAMLDKDTGKVSKAFEPMTYGYATSLPDKYKGGQYPNVALIMYDEFIPIDGIGLGAMEYPRFMDMISTIFRDYKRKDAYVYMSANTVNWDSPFFEEFGLGNVREMKQGTIQQYSYGQETSLALEYCYSDKDETSEEGDRFFAFDNPYVRMIKYGEFATCDYPHLPMPYKKKDVRFTYYIKYRGYILEAEIIRLENNYFTYIHQRTWPVDRKTDLVFSDDIEQTGMNWRRYITDPIDNLGRDILDFFNNNRVYYQNNTVGSTVSNYIVWCRDQDIVPILK